MAGKRKIKAKPKKLSKKKQKSDKFGGTENSVVMSLWQSESTLRSKMEEIG